MSKLNILFLGQFREKKLFFEELKKINVLVEKKLISKLIYVTDSGELSEEEKKQLESFNVIVLEKERLSDKYLQKFDPDLHRRDAGIRQRSGGMKSGTIWRQLYDLQFGLEYFDENDFVLRSRTDISIPEELYRTICKSPESFLGEAAPGSKLGKYKIWIQWFHLLSPFYMHDTAFLGQVSSLKKLISKDLNIELAKYYPTNSLPVFFWIFPYMEQNDIKIWLDKYSSKKVNRFWIFNKEYRSILFAFFNIIVDSFNVEFSNIQWALQWNPGVLQTRIWKKFNERQVFLSFAKKAFIVESGTSFSKWFNKTRTKGYLSVSDFFKFK